MLYLAWKYGGHDPFKLYMGLGVDNVPWSGGPPVFPKRPDRIRSLIYGFAMQAEDEAIAFARAQAGAR